AANSLTRRDLPTPASPGSSTAAALPSPLRCQTSRSRASSSVRATNAICEPTRATTGILSRSTGPAPRLCDNTSVTARLPAGGHRRNGQRTWARLVCGPRSCRQLRGRVSGAAGKVSTGQAPAAALLAQARTAGPAGTSGAAGAAGVQAGDELLAPVGKVGLVAGVAVGVGVHDMLLDGHGATVPLRHCAPVSVDRAGSRRRSLPSVGGSPAEG